MTVAAMRVSNEDRSPVAIHRCDAAPTPTGFAEIVSDDFPVPFHAVPILSLCTPRGNDEVIQLGVRCSELVPLVE
jgi:hypothetical protein